jgi:hypothetical protein
VQLYTFQPPHAAGIATDWTTGSPEFESRQREWAVVGQVHS